MLRLADEAIKDEPIKQEHYRQKQGELYRVEEHIGWICGGKITFF
jgi:hypothetical protein